jgi:hypothetical protein
MSEFDTAEEELWGLYEGQCQACDMYGRVNDLSLCEDCAGKLERDLIRNRDWQYSGAAFGLSPEGCEELRRKVIAEYGEALELIAPAEKSSKKKSKNKKRKRKK